MAMITASVGRDGLNKKSDVKTVQHMLNRKLHLLTPLAALAEDGVAGEQTVKAIEEFQRRVVQLANPDGRVDPFGKTLIALNRNPSLNTPTKKPPKIHQPDGTEPITVTYANSIETPLRIVSEYAMAVVKMALQLAGMKAAVITDTARTPADQARIMYYHASVNIKKQFDQYKDPGDEILRIFAKEQQTKPRAAVIDMMEAKIIELEKNGVKVSRHVASTSSYAKLNVFDLGVKATKAANGNLFSIPKLTSAFWDLKKEGYIRHFIDETKKSNNCWHIEIQPGQKSLPATAAELGVR